MLILDNTHIQTPRHNIKVNQQHTDDCPTWYGDSSSILKQGISKLTGKNEILKQGIPDGLVMQCIGKSSSKDQRTKGI